VPAEREFPGRHEAQRPIEEGHAPVRTEPALMLPGWYGPNSQPCFE